MTKYKVQLYNLLSKSVKSKSTVNITSIFYCFDSAKAVVLARKSFCTMSTQSTTHRGISMVFQWRYGKGGTLKFSCCKRSALPSTVYKNKQSDMLPIKKISASIPPFPTHPQKF